MNVIYLNKCDTFMFYFIKMLKWHHINKNKIYFFKGNK